MFFVSFWFRLFISGCSIIKIYLIWSIEETRVSDSNIANIWQSTLLYIWRNSDHSYLTNILFLTLIYTNESLYTYPKLKITLALLRDVCAPPDKMEGAQSRKKSNAHPPWKKDGGGSLCCLSNILFFSPTSEQHPHSIMYYVLLYTCFRATFSILSSYGYLFNHFYEKSSPKPSCFLKQNAIKIKSMHSFYYCPNPWE